MSPSAGLFQELAAKPCVAILGTARPSDYGRQMARSLARRLSVAGITVAAALREGTGVAAHEGVLDARGAAIAILDNGLARALPACVQPVRRAIAASGCVASELPADTEGRCWAVRAADRTVIALASAVVLIEDEEDGPATFAASFAQREGKAVGAMPGPVTSPLSTGPHALLAAGAQLVAGAAGVLELLPMAGAGEQAGADADAGLPAALRALLDRIGAGADTIEALNDGQHDRGETMAALAELELLGLLGRTAAGGYVPREPVDGSRRLRGRPRPAGLEPLPAAVPP